MVRASSRGICKLLEVGRALALIITIRLAGTAYCQNWLAKILLIRAELYSSLALGRKVVARFITKGKIVFPAFLESADAVTRAVTLRVALVPELISPDLKMAHALVAWCAFGEISCSYEGVGGEEENECEGQCAHCWRVNESTKTRYGGCGLLR